MNVLVFGGSGKVGSAIVWDLVKEEDVETVGIIGRRADALKKTRTWLASPKVKPYILDIADTRLLKDLMRQYDVGVSALPNRKISYKVAEAAIESGMNIVDILEEYHRRPDPYEIEGLEIPEGITVADYGEWLHERFEARDLTFLDGMGFAPGISNITLGEGIRKLEKAESAIARVGGIPGKDTAAMHPLKYMITWAFDHVLREYMIPVKVIKNGEIVYLHPSWVA
jgi:lysine 6-dehydrogenase